MRMFLYYALHSVKNQLKKLFKTWVLIFFVACAIFGGIIGISIGMLADNANIEEDSSYSEEYTEEDFEEEDFAIPEEIKNPKAEFTELAVGLGALLILFLCSLSADKSGNAIFLPADVNLLFASPLKPQSVLMFRLMTQIGTMFLSSIYFAFNIPNLVINLGLSFWAGIGFIAALVIVMSFGKLIQVLLYLVASTRPFIKKNLRIGLFGAIFLIVSVFYLYTRAFTTNNFGDYILAALRFFNHPITRFIPIIGCLKMFCVHIVSGNILGIAINLFGIIATFILIFYLIYKLKVDFYEEAMSKSEEIAELQAIQQQNASFKKRKKDRNERFSRSTLERGFGANVLFYRSMYNRFRFAYLKIFTKTCITYLSVAILLAVSYKFLFKTGGFTPTMLIIGAFVFFRTLGNPLEEDTSKDFFRLVPESTFLKLFWSSLAGSVNCLLDTIPAALFSTLVFKANPLTTLGWILLIISVDFYGTSVGTFINISVPVKAGSMLKNIVQIMFIYFGLVPNLIIVVVGVMLKIMPVAMLICAIINILIGALFLGLTTKFIDFKEKVKV